MLLAGCITGAAAPVAFGQEATAETAAINAAQILFEKKEYAAARELLRAYVADPKAALTFVRAGLALKLTDATDIALMAAQSQQGNATACGLQGLGDSGAAIAVHRRVVGGVLGAGRASLDVHFHRASPCAVVGWGGVFNSASRAGVPTSVQSPVYSSALT